jgi:hypothetical protein
MKISILAAAALLLASTSLAQAAWDQDQAVLALQAQGYTHIEITVGPTQAKVEASNGTTKVETIYDLATGDVVKTETDTVDADEVQSPGIEIKTTNDDSFVDGNDDDEADDNGSDDDQGDDNSGPGGGDDDSGDDDSGDDDSGDDDSGDDDSGDDHGGDDSGHDGGDDD